MMRYSSGVKIQNGWHYLGVQILNNTAINNAAWEDKDVSANVGKRRVLILFRLHEKGAGVEKVGIRTKGNPLPRTLVGGGALGDRHIGTGEFTEGAVSTDENGVFEWIAETGRNLDGWLVGYID